MTLIDLNNSRSATHLSLRVEADALLRRLPELHHVAAVAVKGERHDRGGGR